MSNTIPLITNELGRSWSQPEREEILIDDIHALMSQKTFKKLKQYNCSIPTGVYDGKMWCYDSSEFHRGTHKYLVWYGACDKPDHSRIEKRIIIIV